MVWCKAHHVDAYVVERYSRNCHREVASQGVSIDVVPEDSSIGEWDEFLGETDESDESSEGE